MAGSMCVYPFMRNISLDRDVAVVQQSSTSVSFLYNVHLMSPRRLQATVCGQMVKNKVSFVCNKSELIVYRLDQCPVLLQLSSHSVSPQREQPLFISAGRWELRTSPFHVIIKSVLLEMVKLSQ